MNNLISINVKNKKRVGRGISAGRGMTAGRGTKGQKARAGHNIPNRFEGGQTPISMRLSKFKGHKTYSKKKVSLSWALLTKHFTDKEEINLKSLLEKKLIKEYVKEVKIFGETKDEKKLKIASEIKCSKNIQKLIQSNLSAPNKDKK